jgi:hypothetical protein
MASRLYGEQTSRDFYDERYAKGYVDEWPPEKRRRVFEGGARRGPPLASAAAAHGKRRAITTFRELRGGHSRGEIVL